MEAIIILINSLLVSASVIISTISPGNARKVSMKEGEKSVCLSFHPDTAEMITAQTSIRKS